MNSKNYDVIVIGSGVTGLTATAQLLRSQPKLTVANIEAEIFGGLVTNINELDGEIQGSGIDFAAGLAVEATDLGATMLSERVEKITENTSSWTVTTTEGMYQARAVIIASGATLKKLGIPGEAEFEHKGISSCADCDGPIFSGKDVVVVGGGDSALQEARVLANFCRHVHVLNHSFKFTAKQHLVEAVGACPNVTVRHQIELRAILGNQSVEKVLVRDLADNTEGEVACSGVFAFIGLRPADKFVSSSVGRDADGFLITDASLKLDRGLFAAGAVRSGYGGMLEHAAAEGLAAASQAIKALGA